MKNTILLLLFLVIVSCKAQIIPMNNDHVEIPDGAYLKDTENFLDKFIGTWKYQNGNEQFTIILKKKLKYNFDGYYSDILYGEYKYINPSGQIVINTLDKIDLIIDELKHNISDAMFISNNEFPKCTNCGIGEFRIKSFFDDPDISGLINCRIVFRYINPTTIKVKVLGSNGRVTNNPNDNLPDQPRVPAIEYTMIKQ
ncbi:DUF6705 family protein [Chryseobacterium gambrini]|uniref:DUF6705 family protein n=1 Tax=Chryseobacterium gambrini TaxID=373672 RepID=UPI0022F40497|nr:DUF6705 family protein [Chryseobacterium gambrini]WBX95921.1 hypothetical protein PE065_13670 [Chryseobacterium gambrini]